MDQTTLVTLASQRELVERIKHLSRISSPVILLSGELGIGKTSLCRQLQQDVDQEVRCAYLTCTPQLTCLKARQVIISQLFPQAIFFDPVDSLSTTLARLVDASCDIIFIIDDAHESTSAFLLDLWALKRQQLFKNGKLNITIVLTASPPWCEIQLAVLQEQFITAIMLKIPVLSAREAHLFLTHELVQAFGESGVLRIQEVSQHMLAACHGNPLQLQKLVGKFMKNQQDQVVLIRPWKKVMIGVAVMASVAFVFSWILPVFPEKTTVALQNAHESNDLFEAENDIQETPTQSIDTDDAQTLNVPNVVDENGDSQDSHLTEDSPSAESWQEEAPLPQDELSEMETKASENVASDMELFDASNQTALESIEPASIPEISQDMQWANTQWTEDFFQQHQDHYTLQLVGLSQQSLAQSFLEENKLMDAGKVYQTQRDGKPFFIVVWGNYRTQAEARSAIEQLPQALKEYGPWPKAFAQIQREVQS